MSPDESEADRHIRSLLVSYGAIEKEQTRMATLIAERADAAKERDGRVDKQLEAKADADDLTAIATELRGIKRLLTGLLVSITLASFGFAVAALQFAGSH